MRPVSAGKTPPRMSLRALDARGRIAALADAGSMMSQDVPRASPWLGRFGIAAQDDDGVAIAAMTLGGARVLAAAQDERFVGGSIGARHGEALLHLSRLRPAQIALATASALSYSDEDIEARALVGLGQVYLGLGDASEAKKTLERVRRDHGATPAAARAAKLLETL